ncbi:MAG TPA: [Fe-Fe] hydrogenase large subunit C-terminal domain-containing protein [Rectinemataceae bacterium]|nr:[Fe-Fe] hydrogenase large subunit C-terminal domain-containing protein [Rectinemataceae bacterium]
MDKAQAIYTELTACQDCYKCLRECPVKAIRISENHAKVMGELCINCGHCVEVCPQKAKKVRSDLERAKILVRLRPKSVLSIAPSFAAEFPGVPLANIVAGIKALGFHAVSETSFGADLVSGGLSRTIAKDKPSIVISSACPSVVQYIHKYAPTMSSHIANICSPMVAHGRYLKDMLGQDSAVIFAGPCIAKKTEADGSEGAVDVALTFCELRSWLKEEGIDVGTIQPSSDDHLFPKRSLHGALYPIEGGMIASLKHAGLQNAHCMTFSGIRQIKEAIQGGDIALGAELPVSGDKTLFIELLACEGGCVNGPKSARHFGTVAKRLRVLTYAHGQSLDPPSPQGAKPAESRPGQKQCRRSWDALLVQPPSLMEAPVAEEQVSVESERLALASIGKLSHKDELNCSGCGYDSCRAFARAMLLGKAEKTMCVSYMRNLAQKKANALLKAMPSAAVVVDASMRIVESNKPFAELLGPDAVAIFEVKPTMENADIKKLVPFWQAFQDVLEPGRQDSLTSDFRLNDKVIHGTVFSIEKGLLAGGLFQDITAPWIQKDRVIHQAQTVMRQNLKTVQKIAYLLGENAADAESALTSIIESFQAQGPSDSYDAPKKELP